MALTKIGTDGVKDDAITSGKIPANAVGASELANNAVTQDKIGSLAVVSTKLAPDAVTDAKLSDHASDNSLRAVGTNHIKDEAVTLAKLPHGDANNDGKFLRANNGADPSFETVSIPAGTTINNNADNRVITGSGTANTLEGEANLTYNGTRLEVKTGDLAVTGGEGGDAQLRLTADEGDDGADYWRLESKAYDNNFNLATYASGSWADKVTVNSSGSVNIGSTGYGGGGASPILYLRSTSGRQMKIHNTASGTCGIQLSNNTTGEGEDAGFQLAVLGTGDGFINTPHSKDIRFSTNNTERMRILSGGGLTFNGDTAAANALEDYEEGTWTPQMHDGNGSNVVLSLTSGDNFYTKIGRVVFINGIITRNETGSKSGDLMLTNLPFTGNVVSQLAVGSWWMDRGFGNDTVGGVCYKIGSNTTTMRFVNPTAVHTNAGGDDAAKSATRYLQFGQWQQQKHIYFNLTYMTA